MHIKGGGGLALSLSLKKKTRSICTFLSPPTSPPTCPPPAPNLPPHLPPAWVPSLQRRLSLQHCFGDRGRRGVGVEPQRQQRPKAQAAGRQALPILIWCDARKDQLLTQDGQNMVAIWVWLKLNRGKPQNLAFVSTSGFHFGTSFLSHSHLARGENTGSDNLPALDKGEQQVPSKQAHKRASHHPPTYPHPPTPTHLITHPPTQPASHPPT